MKNPVNKVATFVAVSAAAAGIGIGALSCLLYTSDAADE